MHYQVYSNCIWQRNMPHGHRWIDYKSWIVGHCRTRGICANSSISIQYCKILYLTNYRLNICRRKMMIMSILWQFYLFHFRLIYLWLVLILQIKIRCQISKNFGHLNLEVIARYQSINNQGNISRLKNSITYYYKCNNSFFEWIQDVPILLVGTKLDLRKENPKISSDHKAGENMANEIKAATYVESSALTQVIKV